jgi:Uma2 family endonuclease
MAMPDTLDRWTLAELHRLPDDGNRYELVRGRLFVTPAPSYAHQRLAAVLGALLQPYVEAHGLGEVAHPRSIIRIAADIEVEPDLMVRAVPSPLPIRWEDAPLPSLVIEIMSGTTRRRDLVEKRSLYRDLGIADYWIVDGERRIVRVARPGANDVEVATVLSWQPLGGSAPFVLELAEYFRAALGQ